MVVLVFEVGWSEMCCGWRGNGRLRGVGGGGMFG
jgi:hypothetical protein